MSDDSKKLSRRTALKVIALGVGTASSLPILEKNVLGHGVSETSTQAAEAPRFFNAAELATITIISDLIIPADEHSPGASAAGVTSFIDLMVSESQNEVRALWRNGLASVDKRSLKEFSTDFKGASISQQITLLKEISKRERRPRTIEERFFVAIKSLTVDGYYTSPVGIHQDLQYKGNAYLKEFIGCTHPEHSA